MSGPISCAFSTGQAVLEPGATQTIVRYKCPLPNKLKKTHVRLESVRIEASSQPIEFTVSCKTETYSDHLKVMPGWTRKTVKKLLQSITPKLESMPIWNKTMHNPPATFDITWGRAGKIYLQTYMPEWTRLACDSEMLFTAMGYGRREKIFLKDLVGIYRDKFPGKYDEDEAEDDAMFRGWITSKEWTSHEFIEKGRLYLEERDPDMLVSEFEDETEDSESSIVSISTSTPRRTPFSKRIKPTDDASNTVAVVVIPFHIDTGFKASVHVGASDGPDDVAEKMTAELSRFCLMNGLPNALEFVARGETEDDMPDLYLENVTRRKIPFHFHFHFGSETKNFKPAVTDLTFTAEYVQPVYVGRFSFSDHSGALSSFERFPLSVCCEEQDQNYHVGGVYRGLIGFLKPALDRNERPDADGNMCVVQAVPIQVAHVEGEQSLTIEFLDRFGNKLTFKENLLITVLLHMHQ